MDGQQKESFRILLYVDLMVYHMANKLDWKILKAIIIAVKMALEVLESQ